MDIQRSLENLLEVRREISRVNRAAGETIFNPAATSALDEEIARLDPLHGIAREMKVEVDKIMNEAFPPKRLRDVLPREFFNEHDHSPAAKLLDVEVLKEHSRITDDENGTFKEWPGSATNVHVWWELSDGRAVGFNENPGRGWSFPVASKGQVNGR